MLGRLEAATDMIDSLSSDSGFPFVLDCHVLHRNWHSHMHDMMVFAQIM